MTALAPLGNSAVSATATLTTEWSNPGAPTTVTVSANNVAPGASVTLSWSGATSGTNNPVKSYIVYRSTNATSGFTSIGTPTGTTLAVTSPASNGSYYYKVVAVGTVGSTQSAQSTATATLTTSFTAPSVPANVAVNKNNVAPSTGATLSWSASSSGTNNPLTGYQIQRATSSSGPWSVLVSSQTGTTLAVTSRADNGSYYYQVIALGTYSNSAASASVAYTTSFSAPSTPSNVALSKTTVGASGASTLSWSASTGGTNNAVTGYRIERATASGGPWSVLVNTQTALTLAVNGQANSGSSYFYRVTALAPYGNSAASAVVQLTTSFSAPSTPAGLSLSANNVAPNASVVLSWNASTGGTNNPVSGYRIERSLSASSGYTALVSSQTGRTLSVVARDTGGTSYFYRVIALGPEGNSAASAAIELKTVVGTMSPPSDVRINGATSSTVSPGKTVAITWTAPAAPTNNPITGYTIQTSSSASGTYTDVATVAAGVTSKSVTAPTSVSSQFYRVIALGTYSNSNPSAVVSITVSLTTADASTFSMSSSSVNAGNSVTATITPANSSYTHKIIMTFGSVNSGEASLAAGTNTWSYTVPMSWLNQIPNTLSGTATVRLDTYSGSTLVGRRTASVVIYVPSTVVPTLASFTGTRVDNAVPPTWGVYVVSKSQVDLAMGQGSGAYGSTISSYRLTGGNMNVSGTSPISARSPVLSATSTTFTATVTDSRGRSQSYTVSISAQPYAPPTLSAVSYRCDSAGTESDEGRYGYAKATSTFSSVSGKNSITISSKYRLKDSTGAYTTISNSMTSGTGIVFGANSLDPYSYYEVLYTVVDALGTTITFKDEISAALYILHIRNTGRGLGIGGASTKDEYLDIHWDTGIRGALDGRNRRNTMYSDNGDANAATYEWDLTNGPNTPFGSIYSYLNTIHYGTSNNKMQMAYSYSGGNRLAYRSVYGGTWQPWSEILTDRNYGQYALPLTGGELTGALLVDGYLKSRNDSSVAFNSHIQTSTAGGGKEALFGVTQTLNGSVTDYIRVGQNLLQYRTDNNTTTYNILHSGNYSSYVTASGIGAATSGHVHDDRYIRSHVNAWSYDTEGNPRIYLGNAAQPSNNILLRASGTSGSFQLRNPSNGTTFSVDMFTGELLSGSVPWARLTNVPSSFAPSSHTHTKSQITDFPTSMPASDVYAWAKASTKPTYTYSEVGAAASGHNHDSNYVPYKITPNTDINLVLSAGMYRFNVVPTNGPSGATAYGNLLNVHGGSDTLAQLYFNYNTDDIFFRRGATSWINSQTWKTVLHSGNYTGYALPLSGGTMTGIITLGIDAEIKSHDTNMLVGYNKVGLTGTVFASGGSATYIRSSTTTNLFHRIGSANYPILSSYNYASYITASGIGAAPSSHGLHPSRTTDLHAIRYGNYYVQSTYTESPPAAYGPTKWFIRLFQITGSGYIFVSGALTIGGYYNHTNVCGKLTREFACYINISSSVVNSLSHRVVSHIGAWNMRIGVPEIVDGYFGMYVYSANTNTLNVL